MEMVCHVVDRTIRTFVSCVHVAKLYHSQHSARTIYDLRLSSIFAPHIRVRVRVSVRVRVVRVSNPDIGLNLDLTDKVFFFADSGSPDGPLSLIHI